MKKTQLWPLTFLLISTLFMGCGTKAVYITVTRPAEVNLKDFDKIAVGEIKVNGSGVFSEELMQALFDSERFEVLDHESLKMSLSQNDLVMSSLMEGGSEEEIRTIFGNIVLISGNITEYDYDEELTSRESTHKDKETGKVTTTRTYYREGTARVSASLRVMDLRTAKILAKRKFTKSKTATKSRRNSRPSTIDSLALFEACRENIVRSFMRMIAPYTERVQVSFESAKEMPELASGFNMVKLGNWDAAIGIFQKATATYSNSPLVHKAYYNLGLSYMYTDQFDQAQTALEEAYTRKPDAQKYLKAINDLKARIGDKRRLEDQRRVDPEAAEGDSEPMGEQGQPEEGSE